MIKELEKIIIDEWFGYGEKEINRLKKARIPLFKEPEEVEKELSGIIKILKKLPANKWIFNRLHRAYRMEEGMYVGEECSCNIGRFTFSIEVEDKNISPHYHKYPYLLYIKIKYNDPLLYGGCGEESFWFGDNKETRKKIKTFYNLIKKQSKR